jgi:hypothetical protein
MGGMTDLAPAQGTGTGQAAGPGGDALRTERPADPASARHARCG